MQRGDHREAVPSGCYVLRLARPPKDYHEKRVLLPVSLADDFILSSSDKLTTPPHLSVWVEGLTTHEQAYNFLLVNNPESGRKLVSRLNVDDIRSIVGTTQSGQKYPNLLNVLWFHIAQDFPGASGHAGIVGLDETEMPLELSPREAKNLRKDLRFKLAQLASKDSWLIGER